MGPHFTIAGLVHATQLFSHRVEKSSSRLVDPDVQSNVPNQPKTIWLSIGYHPVLKSVLRKAMKRSPCPRNFNVQVAWRNSLPTLSGYINVHNKALMHQ